jgi:hypothetical protein
MKNKNLLIIAGAIVALFIIFKKKKPVAILPPPPPPVDNNLHPTDPLPNKFSYPNGIYEGMRAQGFDTQYLIQDGKKYGITFQQWQERGFDPGIIVDQSILNLIPDGGLYNNGL